MEKTCDKCKYYRGFMHQEFPATPAWIVFCARRGMVKGCPEDLAEECPYYEPK